MADYGSSPRFNGPEPWVEEGNLGTSGMPVDAIRRSRVAIVTSRVRERAVVFGSERNLTGILTSPSSPEK